MTEAKTIISDEQASVFLATEGMEGATVERIAGGELSQAFIVRIEGKESVLRVNKSRSGFDKDAFAAKHFSSDRVPIPQLQHISERSGLYYCLTDKAPGAQVYEKYLEKNPGSIQLLFETLTAVHNTDITRFEGFGKWDDQGRGESSSWKDYLTSMHDEEEWRQLAKRGVLDVEYLNALFGQFEALLPVLPEERKLVHGDPANDNMFAVGLEVTAVTDWAESMYGDPLFDIAWLEFWGNNIDFTEEYKKYCIENGISYDNYHERIKAYLLYLAITTLVWYIEVNSQDGYHWLRNRLGEKFNF
ncbi:MAG: aminoglycoside phosphotransferase family protein [Patescibacteria group bacterium]